eukprot:COSAG01_NODE_381_length_17848_cov_10.220338_13_plen_155_part_00
MTCTNVPLGTRTILPPGPRTSSSKESWRNVPFGTARAGKGHTVSPTGMSLHEGYEGQHTDGPQAQRLRDATRHKRQGLEILIHRLAATKAFPELVDLMHEPLLIGGILGELVRQPCERVPGRVVACPERLVIEARWGSKPLAFAGKLQPRRLIK